VVAAEDEVVMVAEAEDEVVMAVVAEDEVVMAAAVALVTEAQEAAVAAEDASNKSSNSTIA
jgi:HEAT repeat protein